MRYDVVWKTTIWGLPCSHACCLSIFCPFALYYKTAELLTGGTHRPNCWESLLGGCCCFGGLYQREMLREKYNLKGGECSDYWMHCCCQCFALGQVYREARAWALSCEVCPEDAAAAAAAAAAASIGPAPQEASDDKKSLVRIGPTPTERYDQLLEDIGALQLTNLGKKPNKTYSAAASHGDLDEVKLDHPPTSLNDDTPKIAEALSSKALKLHDDFADERLDAQKLLLQVQEKEEPLQDSARRLGISVGEASGRYNGSASSKPDKQEARPSVVLDEALVRALEQGRVDM